MADSYLFPDIPFAEWVQLWKCGYDKRYGGGPDIEYVNLMNCVHNTSDFESTRTAIEKFFEWKDRFRNRWIKVVQALGSDEWERLKTTPEMPYFWKNGAVYNVFSGMWQHAVIVH